MSSNKPAAQTDTNKTFAYRNIKKEFRPVKGYVNITTQYHLELGEHNETKIVQDRNVDWQELANKDMDKVGLANVLELARKRGLPQNAFMFKDEEALDLSTLDPNDPNAVNQVVTDGAAAHEKLEAIAAQLGVSVDALIDAFIAGTLNEVIAQHTASGESGTTTTDTSEGGN